MWNLICAFHINEQEKKKEEKKKVKKEIGIYMHDGASL